jgi:hypothetical protein
MRLTVLLLSPHRALSIINNVPKLVNKGKRCIGSFCGLTAASINLT